HAARQRLEKELADLARAANFTEVDNQELDRAFNEHSLLKVRLAANLDMVDKIMIFRRGEWVMTERVPAWFGLRRMTVEFPGVREGPGLRDDQRGRALRRHRRGRASLPARLDDHQAVPECASARSGDGAAERRGPDAAHRQTA